MASRTPQLRQSFLLTGAVVALVLVTAFALVSSRSVTRIVERQATEHGQDVASHVAALVTVYLHERRREAEALARSPAIVRAALEASQQATSQRLPQLEIPALERMFNQRRALGGDPELAAYLRDYIRRSEFAELFFTESHGYNVVASNRTSDFVQSDEKWWRRAAGTRARLTTIRRPPPSHSNTTSPSGRRAAWLRLACSRRCSPSTTCPPCSARPTWVAACSSKSSTPRACCSWRGEPDRRRPSCCDASRTRARGRAGGAPTRQPGASGPGSRPPQTAAGGRRCPASRRQQPTPPRTPRPPISCSGRWCSSARRWRCCSRSGVG